MRDRLMVIYNTMFAAYGPQHWWPGDSPWEICVGAVLTQNTNWSNVEKAIANLISLNALDPQVIAGMPHEDLAEAIRPSGYFRLKAERLKAATAWWLEHTDRDKLCGPKQTLDEWRSSLLKVKGVGPETADSILLYCFGLPTFVIDAYTRRIMSRHFGTDESIDYHELRALFMDNLPENAQLFNEFHALFVRNAKEGCRKGACQQGCALRSA